MVAETVPGLDTLLLHTCRGYLGRNPPCNAAANALSQLSPVSQVTSVCNNCSACSSLLQQSLLYTKYTY